MFVTNKTARITGLILILLGIGLIITLIGMSSTGDNDPFNRSETAKFLKDVNDNEWAYILSGAAGIVLDGFLTVAVAACFYVLFRDRSKLLALIVFGGFIIEATLSCIADMNNILLTVVAKDFVEGGPVPIAAGDSSALEVGRLLGIMGLAITNVLFTSLGIALLSLGAVITFAPRGAVNPPKWLGWVALFTGACAELAWLVVVFDPGFVFFIGNFLGSLVLIFGLGIWCLMHSDIEPAAGGTAVAAT